VPLIPPNRVLVFPLKDDLQWYDPEVVFQPFDDIFGRGVVGSTDLQVIQNGTPDGQISVKAGRGYVPYTSGGKRFFKTTVDIRSDAAEFVNAIPAWLGGNPRIHRIISKVRDASITPPDSLKGGVFDVLPGTATAGANLTNLSGAQSVPADSLLLGNVLQDGATITTAKIDSTFGTVRAKATIGLGNSPVPKKTISVGGTPMTDRTAVNFIAGTGISIVGADDAANDKSDLTFAFAPGVSYSQVIADSGVLGSPQSSIDFTGIPAGFFTLQIFVVARGTDSATDRGMSMYFNNDTGTNYDNESLYVTGTIFSIDTNATSATALNIGRVPCAGSANSSLAARGVVTIPGYADTAFHKSFVSDLFWSLGGSGTDQKRGFAGGKWKSSVAINRITFVLGAGNFEAGSRIYIVAS
jgi:hypothetical protein